MNKIQTQVMASVAVIYALRTLLGPTALKLYVLVLSVWGIGRLVWISKVFENLSKVEKSGASAVGNFFLAAVEHTSTSVQLALAAAAIAALLLFFDVVRASAAGSGRFAA